MRQIDAPDPEAPPVGDEVTIVGLDIPFRDLVVFQVKMVFAAIPALVVVVTILYAVGSAFGVIRIR